MKRSPDRRAGCVGQWEKKKIPRRNPAPLGGAQKCTNSKIDLFVFKWPPSQQPRGRCKALLCWDAEQMIVYSEDAAVVFVFL